MRIFFVICLLVFVSSFEANAQQGGEPLRIEIIEAVQAEKQFIEMSHEVIEGEEHKTFLKNFYEALNFKKKVIEGRRWISMNSTSAAKDVVFDSVLLFGLTHTAEMLSGPITVAIGMANGWPQWLVTALGLAGATISIPGLDPLCIVTFITYSRSERFRRMVRTVRFGLVRGIKSSFDLMRVSRIVEKLVYKESVEQSLMRLPGLTAVEVLAEGRKAYEFSLRQGGLDLRLKYMSDGQTAYLEETELRQLSEVRAKSDFSTLKKSAQSFQINSWLSEVFSLLQSEQSLAGKFYIESFERKSSTHFRVRLKANAIRFNPSWRWSHSPVNRCEAVVFHLTD